jgi:WD40 repeat protein
VTVQGFRWDCLIALLLSAGVVSAQEKVRVDALGDPLPAGAVARLGSIRLRPGMWVTHLAFSPDGKQLASWSEAGFSLWDAATGRELRRVERMETRALAFAWLKDGRGLAVLHLGDDRIYVWEFTDPKARPLPGGPPVSPRSSDGNDNEQFDAFAVSPDGKYLAAGRAGSQNKARKIDLFELAAGRYVKELKRVRELGPHPGDCFAVAFSPDGQSLIVFSREHEAKEEWLLVYNPKTGEERRRTKVPATNPGQFTRGGGGAADGVRYPESIKPFDIAPDGRTVAFGPADGAVSLWDALLGKQKQPSPTPNLKGFQAVAFAENGRVLVTAGYDAPIRVWDAASGKKLHELGREPGAVTAFAVSADGRRVAAGGQAGGIRIWDVATGADACPVPGHRAWIWQAAVAPNGRVAVTGGDEKTLCFWDLADGRERHRVVADDYRLLHPLLTPDGKAVLVGGQAGFRLWDADTARPRPVPGALAHHAGWPREFSADGRTLLTNGESTAALWDWPAGTLRREIALASEEKKPGGKVYCSGASLSSDGRLLATIRWEEGGNYASALEIWDTATGRRLHQPHRYEFRHCWPRFVPDDTSLLDVNIGGDLGTRYLERSEKPEPLSGFALWDAVRFYRRPDFVAPSPALLRSRGATPRIALSADGRTLATSLDGRAVTLFEVVTGQVRRQLPAGHHGDITSLAFTADGRRLISASRDQTGLVWDTSLASGAEPAGPAQAAPWDGLADRDARRAYQAMARLAADPEKAVTLLRERLEPIVQPDDAALDRLVTDLGDKTFAVRSRATAELDRLGHAVVPGVLARWAKAKSLEMRRRLEQFLDKHDRGVPPPEALRQRRALEVLEHIGSPQARAVLKELARGSPAVRLTQDAAVALRRLDRLSR